MGMSGTGQKSIWDITILKSGIFNMIRIPECCRVQHAAIKGARSLRWGSTVDGQRSHGERRRCRREEERECVLNTSNKGQTPKRDSRQPKDTKSNSQSSHASTHTLITFLHLSVFLTFRRESVSPKLKETSM